MAGQYDTGKVFGKRFLLNNGVTMPTVGLSTFRLRTEEAMVDVVDKALKAGYRMFDTSDMYGNEAILRHALSTLLPKYKLSRRDLFITSKLICITRSDYVGIRRSLMKTLSNLGLEYLDLYLVNLPMVPRPERKRFWYNIQTLYNEGYMTAIGVSNYGVRDLREITTEFTSPMVNQVEWHPLKHDDRLHRYCKRHDILLQAYSPLGDPFSRPKKLLNHPFIKQIAKKYSVTSAQILLMWTMQHKVAVLPFSTNPEHLYENHNIELNLSISDIMKIRKVVRFVHDSEEEM